MNFNDETILLTGGGSGIKELDQKGKIIGIEIAIENWNSN